jgi:polyisoprenoid-binding protein YceI
MFGILVGFVLLSDPPANAARTFALEEGTLRFVVVHKFHPSEGTSRTVEARARVANDGSLKVMARVRVETFDSGNANRDAHMLEVLDAARFPNVEMRGTAADVKVPDHFPAQLTVVLKGQLTFHGVTRDLETPIELKFADAGHVVAEGSFPISLEAFHVERPALLFVKVDDKVDIGFRLSMKKE